jgi:Domain of unknown function (DUF3291)
MQLAQLNIAKLLAPIDSLQLAQFVANLDRINALAEASPGFVWRLKTESGNATELQPLGPEIIVNVSVWQDIDALKNFVYQSAHLAIVRQRAQWFERLDTPHLVLWWVRDGHQPTAEDACAKLAHLTAQCASQVAFTFRDVFA